MKRYIIGMVLAVFLIGLFMAVTTPQIRQYLNIIIPSAAIAFSLVVIFIVALPVWRPYKLLSSAQKQEKIIELIEQAKKWIYLFLDTSDLDFFNDGVVEGLTLAVERSVDVQVIIRGGLQGDSVKDFGSGVRVYAFFGQIKQITFLIFDQTVICETSQIEKGSVVWTYRKKTISLSNAFVYDFVIFRERSETVKIN